MAEIFHYPSCENEKYPCYKLKDRTCFGWCLKDKKEIGDILLNSYMKPNEEIVSKLLVENEQLEAELEFTNADKQKQKLQIIQKYYDYITFFHVTKHLNSELIQNERKEVAQSRAMDLLKYLGLEERTHHKPGQLSGGEQQRVAVARALMNKPAIVFADEPSGNLDSASSHELHQLLFNLRKDFQQTFIIVTHNNELAQMSDRCLIMEDGKFTS